MNIPYKVEVYDNVVNTDLLNKVFDYAQKLTWHQQLSHANIDQLTEYRPIDGSATWANAKKKFVESVWSGMHRSPLASDEGTLKRDHFVVYLLWKEINRALGSKYQIAGWPEGMFHPAPPPEPEDTNLSLGWRAYMNATHSATVWNSMGYVHRDNPNLDDDTSVTILCILNNKWYPSWSGEFIIFPEDPEGSTGDHQQFHGKNQQRRNFNIGWADCGQLISPVPGRVIVYDGRCLHKTLPTQCNIGLEDTPSIRVAFRARLKHNLD